jgi:hypothetical protein
VDGQSHSASCAALFTLEKQFFNGTVGGAAGNFLGTADDANYNGASDALVINTPAGTAAATASSVLVHSLDS